MAIECFCALVVAGVGIMRPRAKTAPSESTLSMANGTAYDSSVLFSTSRSVADLVDLACCAGDVRNPSIRPVRHADFLYGGEPATARVGPAEKKTRSPCPRYGHPQVSQRNNRRRVPAADYSLAGVLRGSRCGLRSGPSLGRFRPGGAGVRRSIDDGLSLDRLAITVTRASGASLPAI